MSATRHNYLDEARPPESSGNSWRRSGPENVTRNHISSTSTLRKNTRSLPAEVDFYYQDLHNNNNDAVVVSADAAAAGAVTGGGAVFLKNENDAGNYECESDFNQNRLENNNVRSVKARSYCEAASHETALEYKKTPSKRPLSLPSQQQHHYHQHHHQQYASSNRFSHQHQDVEEALSSLLWQPYEYQERRTDAATTVIGRRRQVSVSSDSLSTLSTSSSAEDDLEGQSPRLAQRSRDPQPRPSPSSTSATTTTIATAASAASQNWRFSQCETSEGATSARAGDDQRQQQQVAIEEEEMHVVTVSNAAVGDDVPSNISSVVSANVVGLPQQNTTAASSANNHHQHHHARHASMPAGNVMSNAAGGTSSARNSSSSMQTAAAPPFMVPQHPRNASEPVIPTVPPAIPERNNINCANIVPIQRHHQAQNLQRPTSNSAGNMQTNASNNNNNNVSNVNVNFYRAVPVNVVSNVPTIQCVNTSSGNGAAVVGEEVGNNVSNVHIVQAMPMQTTHTVQIQQQHLQQTAVPSSVVESSVRTRTFTSTEAQTDDTSLAPVSTTTVLLPPVTATTATSSQTREQRRRERRERRHQRRLNSANHQHHGGVIGGPGGMPPTTVVGPPPAERLQMPDILNSHLPPPYSTLPTMQGPPVGPPPPPMVMAAGHHHPVQVSPSALVAGGGGGAPAIVPFVPGQSVVPLVQSGATIVPQHHPQQTGFRIPFPSAGFRRGRYSEEHPKSCCGLLAWRPGSLRWFIALIALVAVCCVLVGTALGAMRPAGRDHLTVSLLMIGVGIVLVTVSGVAWRLTSPDAPSCRALLGLGGGDTGEPCGRRFVPRLPPSYGRPHHPYAAMMYPEFQFRPPPPSYQASMQEYRLRLLLLDRAGPNTVQHAVSPPPTYRSHAGSLLRAPLSNRRDANQSEYSCPPSYRSHTGSTLPPPPHSREHSLSLSESTHASSVNVVNILANGDDKMVPAADHHQEIQPLRMLLTGTGETTKDANLVTIVQTHDQSPVIVTVSGSSQDDQTTRELNSEMEILAHL